jgi:ubiquinone/menaquinone biosynthesis C-methylase UbiE
MLNPNYNFIGIDNCIEFIKICTKQNMNVIQSDMTKIPIKSHSQDAVISIASFHHLSSNTRRLEALKEMRRIIKASGKILISVWSINQPEKTRRKFTEYGDTIVTWNNNRGKIYDRYYYIFNIDEIKELFKKADLILEKHIWDCGNEIFVLHT